MKEKMHTALNMALTSIAEFEAAWIQQLPRERLEQLQALPDKGVRLGFLAVGGPKPFGQVLAVDAGDNWVALEQIQIETKTCH